LCSSNKRTLSVWPSWAAKTSGVPPVFSSALSGLALCSSNRPTIGVWPLSDAHVRKVAPFSFMASRLRSLSNLISLFSVLLNPSYSNFLKSSNRRIVCISALALTSICSACFASFVGSCFTIANKSLTAGSRILDAPIRQPLFIIY